MTQKDVAEHLGIGERRYQDIEYGKTLGSIKHWDTLEDLFQIPQHQLRIDTPPDK
ncbi:MAG: helix-turn-helix transcriptional regulator [Lachnospiraceae bacterium]|nr:helix-turn-helix transcriptional regulator [Lachnospiraceae bacterium]NBJ83355.1 XRE family transcriptional regulator [bacterium 1XD42-76]NBK06597.1 XRE family transcriptional regulator [bacterium 1XD42-94]